uniref:Major facilitator superfamily domain-containing protein 12 n=1 Tax=Syphacia muris TaxID=451379 RepID=A0A0N5B0J4_9BILA
MSRSCEKVRSRLEVLEIDGLTDTSKVDNDAFRIMAVSVNAAICSAQFGMSVLQTLFMFYYVKVFLNVFKINEVWFAIAQILFMIWNSINDPLFGYVQDISSNWMKNRRKVILYLGPFLVLSFYLLWFPWSSKDSSSYICGIHFITALFFYDAFYSFINVAWSALFAEYTYETHSRVTAIKYSQVAVLLASFVLPVAERLSKGLSDFSSFQWLCILIGIIAVCCFCITGTLSEKKKSLRKDKDQLLTELSEEDNISASKILKTTKEVFSQKNFYILVITHFIHSCRSMSHLNFATISTDLLIASDVISKGTWKMSLLYAVCAIVPQILVICSGNFFIKQGLYRTLLGSFFSSVAVAVFFWLTAFENSYMVIAFFFIDSIMVHSIAPLFQILLAEFVDDDYRRFRRGKPISSIIFSLDALIVKSSQSIAPIIVVHILNAHEYAAYQQNNEKPKELISCMFNLLCCTPLLLGTLQLLVFRNWSLRGKRSMEPLRDCKV